MFENLEWRLIAKDEASKVMEKVAGAQKDLADASKKASDVAGKQTQSWKDIAKGVFAGGVALGVAKKGFDLLKSAIVGSIEEGMEYQRVQAQLNAVLISTKGSAGLTADELNRMAEETSKLTAVDGEVITSLQAMLLTFTNITKDVFAQAQQAALDMSSAMNGGAIPSAEQLRSTAIQLGKALNNPIDGITALTRVGVTFSEEQKKVIEQLISTGKVAEAQRIILAELSKEFGGSASAAAQTFEGRLAQLKNTVNDVKRNIGMILIPTLAVMTDSVADATGKIHINQASMQSWQLKVYQTATIIKGIILTIANFIKATYDLGVIFFRVGQVIVSVVMDEIRALVNLKENFKAVITAIKQGLTGDFSGALDTLKNTMLSATEITRSSFEDLTKSMDTMAGDLLTTMDPMDQALKEFADHKKFDAVQKAMNATAESARVNFGGMQDAISDASDSAKEATNKIKNSMEDIKGDYSKAVESASEQLAKLELSHAETTANITKKINELKASLSDLEASYKKTMGEINQTEAEKVIEQEQKIADLKKQISEQSASGGDTSDLQSQLAKEQAAYEAYMAQRKGLDAELTEARRRASQTDFERFIEDINAKRLEAEKDHTDKMDKLNTEIAEQQAAFDAENIIYEAKKAKYLEVQNAFTAFHDSYIANMANMKVQTQAAVDQMKNKLTEMISILNSIESARNKAGLLGSVPTASAASVTGSNSGTTNSSNSVTINLGGVTVGSQADEDRLIERIKRELQLSRLQVAS